ncbi:MULTISPECIES: alpha/beta hydrolase [unclassified Roseateles]|uniref:alpha/beta hydrolase n=1 Tax=unclassified Roseateles TaxID=2626991 RepID=UPI0006FEA059|nr:MULTISPECIES: alpha/beta hydrolase [unclassified Roseateles]KQW45688.1 esterase [Pelomonas sp. Root405]KRA72532.1 esterase [Pelomonas sp. Root662]
MQLMKTGLVLLGIVVLSGALVACSPVTALNALAPGSTHTRTAGVAYGPGARQQLDVYKPASAAPAGGWPVVVFFYGGSWNNGERADFAFVGEALASRGVLALVADYRLYPAVRYPDFLRDSAAALAWGLTRAEGLGGNPRRVFVMGHSAGAYNAAMLALDPRWLAATGHAPRELAGFVGLAGPYDFLPIENPDAKPVFFHPDYPPGTQPLEHASAGAPRSFLAAAKSDKLVDPQRNTQALANKLQAAGVPVTVKFYDRVSHVTLIAAFGAPLRWLAPVLDDVAAFVNAAPAQSAATATAR